MITPPDHYFLFTTGDSSLLIIGGIKDFYCLYSGLLSFQLCLPLESILHLPAFISPHPDFYVLKTSDYTFCPFYVLLLLMVVLSHRLCLIKWLYVVVVLFRLESLRIFFSWRYLLACWFLQFGHCPTSVYGFKPLTTPFSCYITTHYRVVCHGTNAAWVITWRCYSLTAQCLFITSLRLNCMLCALLTVPTALSLTACQGLPPYSSNLCQVYIPSFYYQLSTLLLCFLCLLSIKV